MEDEGMWVKTERSPFGSGYFVIVQFDQDTMIKLKPDDAVYYAQGVLAAAARAEYDAAVMNQMYDLMKDVKVAGQMVVDLRKDRPDKDKRTAPLEIREGVAQDPGPKFRAFLTLRLKGKDYGQMGVEAARNHALHVMEAVPVADLDSLYARTLESLVGIDEGRASQVVADLSNWR